MLEVQTEHVLVVPTAVFHGLGHFQGFSKDADRYLHEMLTPANVSYRPRSAMEQDPNFKQLIPYVIFRYRDDADVVHLFQYTRGKGQGERRLHSKHSIGIGGHISSEDSSSPDNGFAGAGPYEEGMRRELAEEVIIETTYQDARVGLINDDESEVGRVHLGVVHIFDVATPSVRPREADLLDAGFRPLAEMLGDLDGFETWSKISLEALFR